MLLVMVILKNGARSVVINVILILVAKKKIPFNLNSGRNLDSCKRFFILVGEMLILVEHFNLKNKVYSCRKASKKFLATPTMFNLLPKTE